jgi:N-sulfoglucosamine sulfohydrolase
LEAAGIKQATSGMHPITGQSLFTLFNSSKSGQVEAARNYVLVGQERHDLGRPKDVGYPIRGIHKNGMLYLKNYEPDRWPVCNPETGYLNCDGGITKSFILNQRRSGVEKKYWKLCFGHRPLEEMYDVKNDPDCVNNLINNPKYKALATQLHKEMETKLKAEGDLRMSGYGHIYEQYPSAEVNGFYERFMKGEKMKTNWVDDSDYEKGVVDDY